MNRINTSDKPEYAVLKKFLYRQYQEFCEENGLKGNRKRKMIRRLKNLGYEETNKAE